MKLNPVRIVLLLTAAAVLIMATAWLSANRLGSAVAQEADDSLPTSAEAPMVAQESGDRWTTSAEAPAGTPLHRLSPADLLESALPDNNHDAYNGTDALVSWRVTGSALKPREDDVSYTVNANGSCTYVTSGDAFTVWNLAPMLPQGAVVDTLRIYYNDTSGSNSSAWFTVYDLYGAIVDEWSVSTSGELGNGFNDSATINHTVDYSLHSYLLNWRPVVTGSTMQLCGFRVFYTPPPFGVAFLPAVMNNP